MTPTQQLLVDRVRSALPHGRAVREVSMFGGRAVMLDERMLVSAGKEGDLLVRIDPAAHDELIASGARPAMMNPDRPMGPGWITVAGADLETDEQLTRWLDVALDHHAQSTDTPT